MEGFADEYLCSEVQSRYIENISRDFGESRREIKRIDLTEKEH